MIYRLRLIGTGKDTFYRDFEIKSTQTFYDFHLTIQDELKFDKNQMASFFLSNDKWEKGLEVNIFDMAEDAHTPVIIMDNTQLCELLSKKNKRLLYVFDFFSNREFYIELIDTYPSENNKAYPCCISGKGSPPKQISLDDPGLNKI